MSRQDSAVKDRLSWVKSSRNSSSQVGTSQDRSSQVGTGQVKLVWVNSSPDWSRSSGKFFDLKFYVPKLFLAKTFVGQNILFGQKEFFKKGQVNLDQVKSIQDRSSQFGTGPIK